MFRAVFLFLLGTIALVNGALADIPFKLSVVPSDSTARQGQVIYLVKGEAKEYQTFHVILTNVSDQPQPVFPMGNIQGDFTLSFDLTLPDGKKFHVTPGERVYRRQVPGPFLILPGESFIFRIRLDAQWKDRPSFAEDGLTPIKLVVIYKVEASAEADNSGVWAGKVESKSYDFVLNHPVSDE